MSAPDLEGDANEKVVVLESSQIERQNSCRLIPPVSKLNVLEYIRRNIIGMISNTFLGKKRGKYSIKPEDKLSQAKCLGKEMKGKQMDSFDERAFMKDILGYFIPFLLLY